MSIDGADIKTSCGLQLSANAIATVGQGPRDLLIPGGRGVDKAMEDQDVQALIRDWQTHGDGRRIISVCSGALLLARAGLLAGRMATTHWGRLAQAREQFPDVNWSINQLYCVDDQIRTSAGVTSGIDLTLDIINKDCGPSVALSVARQLVVYLKRDGGQNQFSDLLEAQFSGNKQLETLLDSLLVHPDKDWTLEKMAYIAGLTPRTLTRRFSKIYGKSPAKFLERVRVKRAADAISGGASVDKAIEISGFYDFQQMQRAFKRQIDTTIGNYKKRFGGF